jgi:UDP-3-O-[3-hydroxymyristoyl] glucosamine N-acyltransferase
VKYRAVQSTSRVVLQYNIQVSGAVISGTDIVLRDNVIVAEDVNCGRTIFLYDGATVRGKVIVAYGVQITTKMVTAASNPKSSDGASEVNVEGKIDCESSRLRRRGKCSRKQVVFLRTFSVERHL